MSSVKDELWPAVSVEASHTSMKPNVRAFGICNLWWGAHLHRVKFIFEILVAPSVILTGVLTG